MKEKKSPFPIATAGIALVEFALVVPLLILLLLGLAELGRFAYYSIVVGNAARAGVQWGAQNNQTAFNIQGMRTAAVNDGQNNISALSANPTNFCQCWNGTTATTVSCTANPETVCTTGHRLVYVQVVTSGNFNALFNYPLLPSTFSVSATAVMRVSQQ